MEIRFGIMFISNKFCMHLSVSAVVGVLAVEIVEEGTGDLAAALRECFLTLGFFAALVLFFKFRQRLTRKSIKRFDKLGYECPATQRVWTQAPAERSCSKKSSPVDEVSRMVTEHTRLAELVHKFAKEGDNVKAAMAMKMLENKSGTPSLLEYSALVTMCSKANDVEGARMWMRRLEEKGHDPSVVCFNALINAHAKLGETRNAIAVAGEMRDAGVDCDVV